MLGGFVAVLCAEQGMPPLLAVPVAAAALYALGWILFQTVIVHLPRPRHVQLGAGHVRHRHRLAAAHGARLRRRRSHRRKRARQLVPVRRAGRHRQGEADGVRRLHRAWAGARRSSSRARVTARPSAPRRKSRARGRRARHRHAEGLSASLMRSMPRSAARAGALASMAYTIHPYGGLSYTIRSFMIVVVAGLGNLAGVIWAALGLGVAESFAGFILGPQYQIAFVFALLVAVLLAAQLAAQGRSAAISNRSRGMGAISTYAGALLMLWPALSSCGVVAPLLAPRLSVATDRAPALHRVRARLGLGRRADGLQLLRQCAVRRARHVCLGHRPGRAVLRCRPLYRGEGRRHRVRVRRGQFLTGLAVWAFPPRRSPQRFGRLAVRLAACCRCAGIISPSARSALGIAAGQVAAGIPWIGAGSGMLTPNPPADLGDVGLAALLPRAAARRSPARSPSPGCSRPGSGSR